MKSKSLSTLIGRPSQLDRIELLEKIEQAMTIQIQQAGQTLQASLSQARQSIEAELAVLSTKLDNIESLLNDQTPPGAGPAALQFQLAGATPMIVTSAALTAGGTLDQINVVDENGVVLAPATITWSTPLGEADPSDIVMAPSADGMGFNFTASATAPTEAVTLTATWTDPTGVAAPVVSGVLTINITGVGPAAPTSLQFDEVVGS